MQIAIIIVLNTRCLLMSYLNLTAMSQLRPQITEREPVDWAAVDRVEAWDLLRLLLLSDVYNYGCEAITVCDKQCSDVIVYKFVS